MGRQWAHSCIGLSSRRSHSARIAASCSIAWPIHRIKSALLAGFLKKPNTAFRGDCTHSAASACPLRMITGIGMASFANCSCSSQPLISGICTSSTKQPGRSGSMRARKSSGDANNSTENPRSLSEYLTGPGFCGSNALKIAEAAFRFDFERLRTVFLPQGVEARDESNVS